MSQLAAAAPVLDFPPTAEAALERLAAVRPNAYRQSRNSLDGAVTRLSPYITHGFLTLPAVLAAVTAREPLDVQHKFVYELGWREYWRHVWHTRGEQIFQSLHPGVLSDAEYAAELPPDIREARSGVPAIDVAVRTLYATGYLHNHARMWLASYVVHLRKVSWRTGADWMYAHLLDGDLASNHLSWQWVAGTASHKPYLFNADNVAAYAPADWHSPGTAIDATYAALDAVARRPAPATNPATGVRSTQVAADTTRPIEPPLLRVPPKASMAITPAAAAIAGRDVWLIHLWALREPPRDVSANTQMVGVYSADFHARWPLSAARWEFVAARMRMLTSLCWFGDTASLARALGHARSVRTVADPHFDSDALPMLQCQPAPQLFEAVEGHYASFSQWWSRVTRNRLRAADLPGLR